MKSRNNLAVFLTAMALLLLLLAVTTWVLSRDSGESTNGATALQPGESAPRRSLAETPQARFISLFVSNPGGDLASYMVGGKTDEFNAFAATIAGAQPLQGGSDETFTDLLVFSFNTDDSLEIAYSRAHNQFILEDRVYQPVTNLAPMIAAVEQKLSGQSGKS